MMGRAAAFGRLRRPATLVLVGGASTLAYAALAWLGMRWLALPAAIVSLIAYALAAAGSYFAHRRFTFAVSGGHGAAPARFAALSLAGYAIAFAAPLLLTDIMGHPPIWAILLTSLAVPVINAVALARLVFRAPLMSPE